jgi:uncharacterized membrane protein YqjE
MPLRIVDEFKESTSSALRQVSLISVVAFALLVAVGFLCAAGFVFVFDKYGAIIACLAGTAVFLVVAAIAGAIYAIRKQQIAARARQRAKTMASLFADPVVVATGLQIARAVGLKRLIPLLAIGGVALGFLATRSSAQNSADKSPAE